MAVDEFKKTFSEQTWEDELNRQRKQHRKEMDGLKKSQLLEGLSKFQHNLNHAFT